MGCLDTPVANPDKYHTILALVLSIILVCLGGLSIILGGCAFIFEMIYSRSGFGVWIGIFWMVAGAFNILTTFKKVTCLMRTTMILNIISAAACLLYFALIIAQYVHTVQEFQSTGFYDSQVAISFFMLLTTIGAAAMAIILSIMSSLALGPKCGLASKENEPKESSA